MTKRKPRHKPNEEAAARFDVRFGPEGHSLDYHFCRSWDERGGCYGTNKDHGFTFAEGKQEIIKYLKGEIEWWEKISFEKWKAP